MTLTYSNDFFKLIDLDERHIIFRIYGTEYLEIKTNNSVATSTATQIFSKLVSEMEFLLVVTFVNLQFIPLLHD